jgi:uncharacterized protein
MNCLIEDDQPAGHADAHGILDGGSVSDAGPPWGTATTTVTSRRSMAQGAGDRTHRGAGPLVVDIREIAYRPGRMRKVSRVVPAPADLRGELIHVPDGSDLALDVQIESVREGVWVSGTAQVSLTGECARCLEAFDTELVVELEQLFVYPGHRVADDDEIGEVVDEAIDLEPVVHDAVVLALPLAPLCRDDCPGLCPRCGVALATVSEHRHPEEIDARWEALRTLADGLG